MGGANPFAGLVAGKSNMLYGTTYDGGQFGYGIVFSFTLDDAFDNVLHNFSGGKDGAFPSAGLIVDANGILYGTTAEGGRFGLGTIFKMDTARQENHIAQFCRRGIRWTISPLHKFGYGRSGKRVRPH